MADITHLFASGHNLVKRFVDMLDDTWSERVLAHPPFDMLTDGQTGPNRRLRVDDGEADFFAGRKFRTYLPAVIPTIGPPVAARFTCTRNFILTLQELNLTQGALRVQAFTDATIPIVPLGVWLTRPIIGVNRMTEIPQPPYVSNATFEYGGTFTGGTEIDLIEVRTNAQGLSAQNVEGKISERGLPAGTYYLLFSTLTGGLGVNDAAQMIYRLEWMERRA